VRAFHVVGVDLEFGLGEELRVIVQKQRLADLVAVGLLRAGLHEDLALEHARRAVAEHLLEDLPAFAGHRVMGHEDGVVVVEVTVADAGAGDMRHGLVAGELHHLLVARQHVPFTVSVKLL
jgi:hypothetical protein